VHYFYRIVCLLTDFVSCRIYFYLFLVFFEYAEDIVLRERYVQFFFLMAEIVFVCVGRWLILVLLCCLSCVSYNNEGR
jgi:hypothetical protein